MIEPLRLACMPGRKAFSVRKVAVRLPSTTACQSSSVMAAVARLPSEPSEYARQIVRVILEGAR